LPGRGDPAASVRPVSDRIRDATAQLRHALSRLREIADPYQ